MRNIKGWIHDFDNLNSDQKLEVAEAIMEYLKNSCLVFNRDQYYEERTELVCNFLGDLLYCYKGDGELKKLGEMLYKFDNLSEKNQKELVDEIVCAFQKRIIIQKYDDNKDYCLVHGHNFSKWEYYEWTEHGKETDPRWLQEHPTGEYDIQHHDWRRTCLRCGLVDTVKIEPLEVREEREKKERNSEIKKLKITFEGTRKTGIC